MGMLLLPRGLIMLTGMQLVQPSFLAPAGEYQVGGTLPRLRSS